MFYFLQVLTKDEQRYKKKYENAKHHVNRISGKLYQTTAELDQCKERLKKHEQIDIHWQSQLEPNDLKDLSLIENVVKKDVAFAKLLIRVLYPQRGDSFQTKTVLGMRHEKNSPITPSKLILMRSAFIWRLNDTERYSKKYFNKTFNKALADVKALEKKTLITT